MDASLIFFGTFKLTLADAFDFVYDALPGYVHLLSVINNRLVSNLMILRNRYLVVFSKKSVVYTRTYEFFLDSLDCVRFQYLLKTGTTSLQVSSALTSQISLFSNGVL